MCGICGAIDQYNCATLRIAVLKVQESKIVSTGKEVLIGDETGNTTLVVQHAGQRSFIEILGRYSLNR